MFPELHIKATTEEGYALLKEDAALHLALARLVSVEEPHKEPLPHLRLLGAGRYGYTFAFAGIALKITSPTTSREAVRLGRPVPPENLIRQYQVLSDLGDYLGSCDCNIIVPAQYFVAHSPHNAYLLGQELMTGWHSYEEATRLAYQWHDPDDPGARREVKELASQLSGRLTKALRDFARFSELDDLIREDEVNGGNLLVPVGVELTESMPLCIIDQPGHHLRATVKKTTEKT